MSFEVLFADSSGPIAQAELSEGKHQVGSDPNGSIAIRHREVAPRALALECSGGVVFVENCNSYSVYIGREPLAPGQITEWRDGTTIQLTRSVSASLRHVVKPDSIIDDGSDLLGSRKQMAIQAGVIACCLLLCTWMLTTDSKSRATEEQTAVTFDELVSLYEQAGGTELVKLKHEHRILLTYLTEARGQELRWQGRNQKQSRQAYELILASNLSSNLGSNDQLMDLTQQYAASRIAALE